MTKCHDRISLQPSVRFIFWSNFSQLHLKYSVQVIYYSKYNTIIYMSLYLFMAKFNFLML